MFKIRCLTFLVFSFVVAPYGFAQTVRVDFTGVVSSVDAQISSAFSPSDPVVGSFLVDLGSQTDQANTRSFFDLSNLDLMIGSNTISSPTGDGIVSYNNPFSVEDSILLEFTQPNLSASSVNGLTPNSFDIFVLFPTTAFTDGSFPTSFPAPTGPFGGNWSEYEFTQEGGPALEWDWISGTVTPVPEPSSLTPVAFLALGFFRRRRQA